MHFGGNGLDDDGQPLYINLIGEVLPLGIGFTNNPAADVKGVKVFGSEDLEEENEKEEESSSIKEEVESSQLEEKLVETNIISNKLDTDSLAAASDSFEKQKNKKENNKMLIKSIQDLTDDSLKQICATDIRALFEEEIKKAGEKFAEAQEAKDKLVADAEKTKAELEAQLEELKQTGGKMV